MASVLAASSAVIVSLALLSGCRKEGHGQRRPPHYQEAVEAYRMGEYGKAVSLFKEASLHESSNAEIYLDIAAIYDDILGETPRAVLYYEKYLELAGDGEKAEWVKGLLKNARERLPVAGTGKEPGGKEPREKADLDQAAAPHEGLEAPAEAAAEDKRKADGL